MIDQFASMGTTRISFGGGEALLRDDLGTMIDYSAEKGLITTFCSNGVLVKSKIDSLKKLDLLMISLDGPPEIHNKRRGATSYEEAITAIKAAKEAGIEVWTITVLTADNLQCIDFILEKAEELGVRTIFQPVVHYLHSAKMEVIESIVPPTEAYKKAINKLMERKRAGAPIVPSLSYFRYIARPYWKLNPRLCWATRLHCAVTPSGEVAPCHPVCNQRKWPSGLELGFKRAFESIPKFTCEGCWCFAVEGDFLYSFNLEVIYNIFNEFRSKNSRLLKTY
jgi:MoaA/NifB/PqqE/SkfB family radical SAM enzyme